MSELKLYAIETVAETDWVAAHDEQEAREVYMTHYTLNERDMDGVDIELVDDPETVQVYLDEVDAETEEMKTATAAEVMATMKSADLVCSTCM